MRDVNQLTEKPAPYQGAGFLVKTNGLGPALLTDEVDWYRAFRAAERCFFPAGLVVANGPVRSNRIVLGFS